MKKKTQTNKQRGIRLNHPVCPLCHTLRNFFIADSSGSRNKKRKRSKNDKKPKSISPMGKRLSSAGGGGRGGGPSAGEMVGYPIGGQGSSVFGHSSSHGQSAMDDYEQKVCSTLLFCLFASKS